MRIKGLSHLLIQRAVFQPLSNKQSIVAVSPTGSGKTLAYLLASTTKRGTR